MSNELLTLAVGSEPKREADGWSRFAFDVLKPEEAARYLEIYPEVLTAEAEAGRVPGQKLGGEWRFLRLALIEWLRTGPKSPNREPESGSQSSKERMRSLIGAWKDDPTVDAMIEEIYRQRKADPVGRKRP